MHGLRREPWHADRDVLGAALFGCAVTDPLARRHLHGLSRPHVNGSVSTLDAKHAAKDDRELRELGALSWFSPPRRAHHACDAQLAVTAVHRTDELFDPLGFVAGSGNNGGNYLQVTVQGRHEGSDPWATLPQSADIKITADPSKPIDKEWQGQ